MKTEKKFELFINSLLEKRIIPLVGAGVSIQDDSEENSSKIPNSKELEEKLEKIWLNQINWRNLKENSVLLEVVNSINSLNNPGMAKLAEVIGWFRTKSDLCKELDLKNWSSKPTRAHRYLVRLALDKLITEIISTNYDRCFEAAWEMEYGQEKQYSIVKSSLNMDAHNFEGDEPYLILYKINGCISLLEDKEENKKPKPEEIILTDTELQGYCKSSDRKWIKDLLRHRARSKQLILSGFGSDEPQVWHVLGSITEEIRTLLAAKKQNGKQKNTNFRILWVSFYEKNLPFHILRALIYEFLLNKNHKGNELIDISNGKESFENVFTGNDYDFFKSSPGKLDAGDFWYKVWIESFKKRMKCPNGVIARTFIMGTLKQFPRNCLKISKLQKIWTEIVNTFFDEIHMSEKCEKNEMKTGMDVVKKGDYNIYIRQEAEPVYWVNVMLLTAAFSKNELISLSSKWNVIEPVIMVSIGSCSICIHSCQSITLVTKRDEVEHSCKFHKEIPINLLRNLDFRNKKELSLEAVLREVKNIVKYHALHLNRRNEYENHIERRKIGGNS